MSATNEIPMSNMREYCDKDIHLWPLPITLGWWGGELKMFDVRAHTPLPPFQFTIDFRPWRRFRLPSGLMLITARHQMALSYPYRVKDGRAKMWSWRRLGRDADV